MDLKANSAVKIRLYPNARQDALFRRAFVECARWYNLHLDWYLTRYKPCAQALAQWISDNPTHTKAQLKEFNKSLPWPPMNKMGWPKSVVHPDETYTKRFGDIRFVAFNCMNEYVEDALAKAIQTTQKRSEIRFKRTRDASTFTVVLRKKELEYRKGDGRISHIRIPFLAPRGLAKTEPETEWVKCKLSDEALLPTLAQTAITVTRNKAGEYFAAVRTVKKEQLHLETGKECGIDLGVSTSATVAYNAVGETGTEYDKTEKLNIPVDKIKRIEATIAHLQKLQARRVRTWLRLEQAAGRCQGVSMNNKRGPYCAMTRYLKEGRSKAFDETQHRIAQLNEKIKNVRKDFVEQTSCKLAKKCDIIGMENLNVKGMTRRGSSRKSGLNRAILRIGFYAFRTAIARKAKVVLLDRFAPSSKVCCVCGKRTDNKMGLNVREWTCEHCGEHHDRDENAASNIRPSRHEILISLMAERCRRAKGTDKTPESTKHTPCACGCRGTETKTRKRKEGVPRETCKSDSRKVTKSNQNQRLLFPEFGLQSVSP